MRLGDVMNPKTGNIIAGARSDDGKSFINTDAKIRGGYGVLEPIKPLTNTTIGVVATNAALDKTQLTKVAQMAHDRVGAHHQPDPHPSTMATRSSPFRPENSQRR